MQRDNCVAGGNDDVTVDVIGVDDHDKENDCDSRPKDIPGSYDRINNKYVLWNITKITVSSRTENFTEIGQSALDL